MMASYGFGGMELSLNGIAQELEKNGYEVVFLIGTVREAHIPFPQGIKVHVLGDYVVPGARTPIKFARSFLESRTKIAALKKQYQNYLFVSNDIFPGWVCLSLGIKPLLLWLHFSVKYIFASSTKWIVNRMLFRMVDGIIVPTASMAEEIEALLGSSVGKKTIVIPNPVPTKVDSYLYNPDAHYFAYVGRLVNHQKRVDRVLRALGKLASKQWKLLVIGDGDDKEHLQDMAISLGINDRIAWVGWQDDPWEFIEEKGGVSALLLTSDYEGYGRVLVEAMARGIPCVAVDCPVGPSDIIKNGINGVLIDLTTDDEIVKRLANTLEELCEGKIVFNGYLIKSLAEEYDVSTVTKKWVELIGKEDNQERPERSSTKTETT